MRNHFTKKYIYTINHKRIALNYLYFSMFSGLSGAMLASFIRLELAYPGSHFFKGDSIRYIQVISAHGLVMIFYVVIPIIFGFFANYFIPYHILAKDVAFPRLNSIGFWLLPAGFLMMSKPAFTRRQVYRAWDPYEAYQSVRKDILKNFKELLSSEAYDRVGLHASLKDIEYHLFYFNYDEIMREAKLNRVRSLIRLVRSFAYQEHMLISKSLSEGIQKPRILRLANLTDTNMLRFGRSIEALRTLHGGVPNTSGMNISTKTTLLRNLFSQTPHVPLTMGSKSVLKLLSQRLLTDRVDMIDQLKTSTLVNVGGKAALLESLQNVLTTKTQVDNARGGYLHLRTLIADIVWHRTSTDRHEWLVGACNTPRATSTVVQL